MEPTEELKNYVWQQLQGGISPDTIASHLQASGWSTEAIQASFQAAQVAVMPSFLQSPTDNKVVSPPTVAASKRGRFKTSWLLLKQSMKVLRGNPQLFRYMLMTIAWGFLVVIIFGVIFWFGKNTFFTDRIDNNGDSVPTAIGYVVIFIYYVLFYFVINFYAAALTYAIFDIFGGQLRPYREYVRLAFTKAGSLFVFSIFEATVGMILRYIVERIRFVGWILSWLLGAMWSLGTMFTIPYIVSSEVGAPTAVKQSLSLFKSTWGENIITKASVNAPIALLVISGTALYFFIAFSVILSGGGITAFIITFFLYLFALLTVLLIGSFANSLVNAALFYYATKHEVPPAFDADLLNRVFIKKKRRFFGKKETDAPAQPVS